MPAHPRKKQKSVQELSSGSVISFNSFSFYIFVGREKRGGFACPNMCVGQIVTFGSQFSPCAKGSRDSGIELMAHSAGSFPG